MAIDSTISGITRYVQGSATFIEEKTASSSATLDFNAFSSVYDEYVFELINILPATNNVNLYLRVSTDGGATYDAGTNYTHSNLQMNSSAATPGPYGANATNQIIPTIGIANTANLGTSGRIHILGTTGSAYKHVVIHLSDRKNGSTDHWNTVGSGAYLSATAVNGARFLFSSGNIASGTIRVYGISRLTTTTDGNIAPIVCNGRLTTETGVPVSTTDRTSQSTIYFTPYQGNQISLYDGARWNVVRFNEFSLALSGLTSGKAYDVYASLVSGVPTLSLSVAYASATARTDAQALQDGVLVKSGSPTLRNIGTIYTTATTTTEDSATKRFIWNRYNACPRAVQRIDSTDSWNITTVVIRQANSSAANQIEVVAGDVASVIELVVNAVANVGISGSNNVAIGIGEDSTTVFHAACLPGWFGLAGINAATSANAVLRKFVPLGYHKYTWLEAGVTVGGTSTMYGDAGIGSNQLQSGLIGTVWN